jgi:hypothetical protein
MARTLRNFFIGTKFKSKLLFLPRNTQNYFSEAELMN